MQKKALYPEHPVRATLIAFGSMCVFVGAFLPFQEQQVRQTWPLGIGYCAFLAVVVIGLIRLGPKALLWVGVPAVLALLSGALGTALALRTGASLDSGGAWLQVSRILFCALGVWGVGLAVRGWWLYFRGSHETA